MSKLNNTIRRRNQDVACLDDLPPPVLQDKLFLEDWVAGGDENGEAGAGADLSVDSYIFCFTGPRGSGKTTLATLFACRVLVLNRMRILSNYPIEFDLKRAGEPVEHVKAELLDWEKLLCFDDDYSNCLIVLDEAADVISHLASMTWKNRLLNIFIRQLRKNRNSLFLCSQQLELIDKSMRWQVDLEVKCSDASRRYNWPSTARGECILFNVVDWSGLWSGMTSMERADLGGDYYFPGMAYPRFLWGEKSKTKPVFDSWYTQDIFESLRRVDMKFSSYKIGPPQENAAPSVNNAAAVIDALLASGTTTINSRSFYESLGQISPTEKDAISKRLSKSGVKIVRAGDRRVYDFSTFDPGKF